MPSRRIALPSHYSAVPLHRAASHGHAIATHGCAIPLLHGSPLCPCYTMQCHAIASLYTASHCRRRAVPCFTLPRRRRVEPGHAAALLHIAWLCLAAALRRVALLWPCQTEHRLAVAMPSWAMPKLCQTPPCLCPTPKCRSRALLCVTLPLLRHTVQCFAIA
nr:MAG TPA: hypothetical protein [Caudoviricetes sp.]